MTRGRRFRTTLPCRAGAMAVLCAMAVAVGCTRRPAGPADDLDRVAGTYLQLVNALTRRDPDSNSGDTAVALAAHDADAPSPGFAAIAAEARAAADSLRHSDAPDIRSSPSSAPEQLLRELRGIPEDDRVAPSAARRAWLMAQLDAVATRAAQQAGERFTLDQDLRQLFGVSRAALPGPELDDIRKRIDGLLPGRGSAAVRLEAFEAQLAVPSARLPRVFERALEECRTRTLSRITMPRSEHVTVEYVSGRPWSAFSTYAGSGRSVVAVNTAFPLTVDRVLQLACHEGYPGHHVINTKRDERRTAGRPELGAVPLFSPEAFNTEALASRAASLAFTDDERLAFERDVLFPLAGLAPGDASAHVEVARLVEQLAPSIEYALSRYLAGERDYIETTWALQTDALMQHPQATLLFANQFRGFALAYTRLPDLVRDTD